MNTSRVNITLCPFVHTLSGFEYFDYAYKLVNTDDNPLDFTKRKLVVYDDLPLPFYEFEKLAAYYVFAWDDDTYYGMIGFIGIEKATNELQYFVFSPDIKDRFIESYCFQYITSQLKCGTTFKIPVENTFDHIIVHNYTEVENFIRNKELLPLKTSAPIAALNGHCQNHVFLSFSSIDHILVPVRLSSKIDILEDQIKNHPRLIIYNGGIFMSHANRRTSEYLNALVTYAKKYDKKILFVMAALDGNEDQYVRDFFNLVDTKIDNVDVFKITGQSTGDYMHYTRSELKRIGLEIKDWVEAHAIS